MAVRFKPVVIASMLAVVLAGCSKDPAKVKAEAVSKAEAYEKSGKHLEAIIEYKNAIKADPKDATLHEKLASVYLSNSQGQEAFLELRKTLDMDPNLLSAKITLAQVYLMGGLPDDALKTAEEVSEKKPDDLSAKFVMANAHAAKKEMDDAIAIVQQVIKDHPDMAAAHQNLGAFYMGMKDTAKARQEFEKAVQVEPKNVEAKLTLAGFYRVIQDMPAAEREYKEAISTDPKNSQALNQFAAFLAASNRASEAEPVLKQIIANENNSAESRFNLAGFYLGQHRVADAKALDEQIMKDSDQFMPARLQLAELALNANQLDEAEKLLGGVPKERTHDARPLLLNARLLLMKKDTTKAIQELEQAQKADPSVAALHYYLGMAYAQAGNLERAQSEFEQTIGMDANATDAYMALARMMLDRQKPDATLKYTDQVLARQPGNPEAVLMAGFAYMQSRNLSKAEAQFQKFAQMAPNSEQGPLRIGAIRMLQKKYDDAQKQYEKALQLNPNSMDALEGVLVAMRERGQKDAAYQRMESELAKRPTADMYTLAGKLYAGGGDVAKAEANLNKALELKSQNFNTFVMLGTIYAQQKKPAEAVAEFENAVKLNPYNASLVTMMGMLQQQAGQVDAAQKSYEKALQLDPTAGVAANNLSIIYSEHGGDMDKALDLARRAKIALPDVGSVSDTLGWLYAKRQLYPTAIPLLQEAVKSDPKSPEFHLHLAWTLAQAGKQTEAKTELATALRLDPAMADRPEAKQMVAK